MTTRLLRPLFSRPQTAQSAARLYRKRQRRKSIYDPTFELFETHRFDESQNPIGANRFDNEAHLAPVTFHTELVQTGASPNGIVFAFGDNSRGVAMWLDRQDIGICAGGPATNGVTATVANALRGVNTERLRLTMIAHPGYGAVALYIDDDLRVYSTSSSNQFQSGWASVADGAVGEPNTSVPPRVPGPNAVALADAVLVKEVRAFEQQYPRQLSIFFGTSGTTSPLGPITTPTGTGGSFNESFNESFDGGTP